MSINAIAKITKESTGDFTRGELADYTDVTKVIPENTQRCKIEQEYTEMETASETFKDGKETVSVTMVEQGTNLLSDTNVSAIAKVTDNVVDVGGVKFKDGLASAVKMIMQAEIFDRYAKVRKGVALYEVFANGLADGVFKDKKGKPLTGEKAYNAFIAHLKINRTNAYRWRRFAEFSSYTEMDENGKRHLRPINRLLVVPEAVLYYAYTQGIQPEILADYCSTQTILPKDTKEFYLTYNAYAEKKNVALIENKQNGEAEEEQKQEAKKQEEKKQEEKKQEEQKKPEEPKQEEQKPEEQKSFFTTSNRFTSGKAISIAKYTENLPVTLVMTDTEADIEKRLAEESIKNGNAVHFSVMLTNKSERLTPSSTISEADMLTITTFQLDTVGSNEYTHVRTFVILVGKCTIWASEEALQKAQEDAETQEEPKPEAEAEEQKQEAEEQKPKSRRSRRQK